jgi:hypothetical protein
LVAARFAATCTRFASSKTESSERRAYRCVVATEAEELLKGGPR